MGPDWDKLATLGSAVNPASVARHVTDWATWPGMYRYAKYLNVLSFDITIVRGYHIPKDFSLSLYIYIYMSQDMRYPTM